LTEVIKRAKRNYYNNLIINSNNKTRTTWKIINDNINKDHQQQDISYINIKGSITRNNQTIANTFNDYYSSVAQLLIENHNESNTLNNKQNPVNNLQNIQKQITPLDKLQFVSPKEIENVVKSLQTKESHGYDEIPTKVIKQNVSYISSPMAYICNLMLSSGVFPNRLKFAEIKPFINMEKGRILPTTDQYHYYHRFQKFFKN